MSECTIWMRVVTLIAVEDFISLFDVYFSLSIDKLFSNFSCALDAYYKILTQSHLNSGYKEDDLLSYDKLKSSWYSFLDLLDVTNEKGSMCKECKQHPDIIICDATGLSFQRKFAAQNIEVSSRGPIKKFS